MKTRYTYLGETTIEVVIDGDCVEVNLLPSGPADVPAVPAYLPPPEPAPVAAPLELCAAAPEPDPAAEEEALQLAASSRRPKRPPDAPVEPQEPVLAAPLPEAVVCAAEPAPTKKRRTLWGAIRATWFVVFTIVGESLTYALNNLTSFNLPPGTATAIGAVGYGVKRGIWPDTTL